MSTFVPKETRLRFFATSKPEMIPQYLKKLGRRVEVKSIVKDEETKRWFLWFVVSDSEKQDIESAILED